MAKLTISMPDSMSAYVSGRIEEGHYRNVSEYFRDLVRRDRERQNANARLRALIDEGEASGIDDRSVEEIWAEGEARVLRRDRWQQD
jgi:antitoxin ParD1/3/4